MPFELLLLFKDKRFWRGAGVWTVLLYVALNIALGSAQKKWDRERQENLYIATHSSADSNPRPVRWDASVGEKLSESWPLIPDATRQPLFVLAGMSQMYVINDRADSDETISELLDDRLAPLGERVFGLAAPNMCNEEATMLLIALSSGPQTTPRIFMYGVCFDKFRNTDLRSTYQSFLHSHQEVLNAWRAAADRYQTQYPQAAAKMRQSAADLEAAPITGKKTVEARIRDQVGRLSPLVANREALNFKVIHALGIARNAVFHITATSKRPQIPAVYESNRQFLGLMADVAREKNIQLILYIIPLNPQAENPYVAGEYAEFKSWVEDFSHQHGIASANLENVVPREDWGLLDGGPDFKHFREGGHRKTADAILSAFHSQLVPATMPASEPAAR